MDVCPKDPPKQTADFHAQNDSNEIDKKNVLFVQWLTEAGVMQHWSARLAQGSYTPGWRSGGGACLRFFGQNV